MPIHIFISWYKGRNYFRVPGNKGLLYHTVLNLCFLDEAIGPKKHFSFKFKLHRLYDSNSEEAKRETGVLHEKKSKTQLGKGVIYNLDLTTIPPVWLFQRPI